MAFQINHVSDQSLSFINKLTSAISQISYELWEQKVHGFESVCWVSKTNKINVQRWTYQHMMHSHQLKFAIRDSRAIGCYYYNLNIETRSVWLLDLGLDLFVHCLIIITNSLRISNHSYLSLNLPSRNKMNAIPLMFTLSESIC